LRFISCISSKITSVPTVLVHIDTLQCDENSISNVPDTLTEKYNTQTHVVYTKKCDYTSLFGDHYSAYNRMLTMSGSSTLGYSFKKNDLHNNIMDPDTLKDFYENHIHDDDKQPLASPYTEDEIKTYEDTYDVTLPSDFKMYLTSVSKDCFMTLHDIVPVKVHLIVDPGSNKIPVGETIQDMELCDIHKTEEDCLQDRNENNCTEWRDGMINIGYDCYYVVKGNEVGTVWVMNNDKLHKEFRTFTDYTLDYLETCKYISKMEKGQKHKRVRYLI
jgi:hypothetical protein